MLGNISTFCWVYYVCIHNWLQVLQWLYYAYRALDRPMNMKCLVYGFCAFFQPICFDQIYFIFPSQFQVVSLIDMAYPSSTSTRVWTCSVRGAYPEPGENPANVRNSFYYFKFALRLRWFLANGFSIKMKWYSSYTYTLNTGVMQRIHSQTNEVSHFYYF